MHSKTDSLHLLRVAAGLWLVYLGISAAIAYTLKSSGPTDLYIYIGDGVISAFFFGISFWPWIQNKLGKAFLPAIIILVCALPIGVNQVAIRYLFQGPLPAPGNLLASVVPFLLIALILIAWQYRWQHILLFSLIIALLNVAFLFSFYPYREDPFTAGLFAILNQVVIFLVVGFFINVMVGWLNSQKRALEEANLKLTNYSATLEDLAVSRERNRIAQELHDTLSHTLSGLSLQQETMKAYWDVDIATARKILEMSQGATRSGLEETRRVLMALRAKPLVELGLAPAIRQMAEEASAKAGLTLDLNLDEAIPPLSSATEQCLYRVAQEAITNVIKHARAKTLTVKLECKANRVLLVVQDDGVGFDIDTKSDNKNFGLLGMKERSEFVKGELNITSQPGIGTTVNLTI